MYPEDIEDLQDLGSTVVCEKNNNQLRLSVTEFHGELYLALRWWNLSFDGDSYFPTKEGVTIPYNLDSVGRLWESLVDLLSEGEVLEKLIEHGVRITPISREKPNVETDSVPSDL